MNNTTTKNSTAKNSNQKAGNLHSLLNEEVFGSSTSILAANRGGNTRGLQQYFVPGDVAAFIASIVNPYNACSVFDPTAGDGSLLGAYPAGKRFGVEIDGEQIDNADAEGRPYTALQGDLQRLFPLMRMAGAKFACIVANPPFGLGWNQPGCGANPSPLINGGKPCSSTRWTWEAVQLMMKDGGQGAFITGTKRMNEEILADPEAATRVYAVVDIADMFPGVALECSVAFFADPNNRRASSMDLHAKPDALLVRLTASRAEAAKGGSSYWIDLAETISTAKQKAYTHLANYDGQYGQTYTSIFADVQREHIRRMKQEKQEEGGKRGRIGYDIEISGGKIRVNLSPLSQIGIIAKYDHPVMKAVAALSGNRVNYFALNGKDWTRAKKLITEGVLTMHPADQSKVEDVCLEAAKKQCPVYAVKPQQRLGFLEDTENILCILSDPAKGFTAGQSYPISTESAIETTTRTEIKPDKTGNLVENIWRIDLKVLKISITGMNERGATAVQNFNEGKDDLEYMMAHFDMPDPGDLSTRFPAEMEKARETLRIIERDVLGKSPAGLLRFPNGLSLKNFQREDGARMLIKQGGLLSWEQGLGKAGGSMVFAMANEMRGETGQDALFIVPQDLIGQWQQEAQDFFGRTMVHIATRNHARAVAKGIAAEARSVKAHNAQEKVKAAESKAFNIAHGIAKSENYVPTFRKAAGKWYITHYEALSLGQMNIGKAGKLSRIVDGVFYRTEEKVKSVRGVVRLPVQDVFTKMGTTEIGGWSQEHQRYIERETIPTRTVYTSAEVCPSCRADSGLGWDGETCRVCKYHTKMLQVKNIASELATAFRHGTICVDEGTKIQGDDSLTSKAVRGLRAKRKLVASGTPIKGFTEQIFHLAGWSLGYGSPRFPYAYNGGKAKFISDFCITEKLMDGNKVKREKRIPGVTNVSMFWKLFCGNIVRRRKEDTGEPLVPRLFVPVTVPMGVAQHSHTSGWLDNFVDFYCQKNPIADPKMVEISSAILGLYAKLNWCATMPTGDKDAAYLQHTPTDWTPKNLEVMQIAARHMLAGEKVLIGSDCMTTGKFIADALSAKGFKVGHIVEGEGDNAKTMKPEKRGLAVAGFQKGDTQALCAGVQSINLGFNIDAASVVILTGLPWDFATLDQFLARAHRLTSKKPITIYVVMTQGSMDERKWALLQKKTQGVELALDGELFDKPEKPVSQQEVINAMRRKGIPFSATKTKDGETADEVACKAVWDAATFDHSANIVTLNPTENISINISLEVPKVDTKAVNCGTLFSGTTQHENNNSVLENNSSAQVVTEVVTKDGGKDLFSLEFLTQGGRKMVYTPRKPRQFTLPHTESIDTGLFA